jgi:DNA (cytosine-5)-methyltransferase 1
MKSSSKFRTLSLFSGGMGLDVGLHQTGRFEHLACIEYDAACCETIKLNRDAGKLPPKMRVIHADIKNVDARKLREELGLNKGELDVIVGGPPCQSFSTAGKRGTVQDTRGTLLWDFLRFVDEFQPKFFLMENVRGLLSAALKHRAIAKRPSRTGGEQLTAEETPGSVVNLFCEDLMKVEGNYHLDCFEVNSVNYGAPQIRERAIFIGNRFGVEIDFPNPTHGPAGSSDDMGMLPFEETPKLVPWKTLRDAIAELREDAPEVLDFSPRKKSFLRLVPEGSNWRSLPEALQKESMGRAWFAKGGRSGWWRRLTFDLPCPTLVTLPNHASTSLCHPTETRALSIREYARIQEFPDDWEFSGKLSEKYKQVGNAVPVRLAVVAGGVIATALDELKQGTLQRKISASTFRKVYIQSHVRTRRWYKDGLAVVWDEDTDGESRYSAPKTLRKTSSLHA